MLCMLRKLSFVLQTIKCLVEWGADVNKVGVVGDKRLTPIFAASQHGHMHVARYLFNEGAVDCRVEVRIQALGTVTSNQLPSFHIKDVRHYRARLCLFFAKL